MANPTEQVDSDILQKILDEHADKMTADTLEACGIPAESLIDAAANLLHEHEEGKPAIHKLCEHGVALLIKLCLCAGYECGVKSCAGFRKPS